MRGRQKRKHLESEESQETAEKGGGISKSQEDPPQLESPVVAQGRSPGAGEVSSASEYFSCASSPRKLIHGGIRRLHQDTPQPRAPLARVQQQGETAPPPQCVAFSSPSSNKTSLYTNKEERGMKIYYMRVKTIKGVAVSWETEKPLGLLEKRLRIEEVTLPEDVRVGTPRSDVSTRNLLSDSEPTGEEKECEERAEPYSPSGSPAVQERPRAKTPDWLVTMENGFRCMACCRVFPTLEILQQHVRYGVQEGFSCHVFHLTMAQLMGNVESESTTEEEVEEEEKQGEKENEEEQPTGEGLSLRRPWSQRPGCVFHSPKDRNN
ncbi:protein FAM170A [Eubalaena glacialis]|uniref:protein FAM170A n=1 Tax=Eubalaena glacialis TaxID=27606 RepID=UPI002A5A8831|nr:protein FAM170A [Eubalaena glacialis]